MRHKCFMLTLSEYCRRWLRRYTSAGDLDIRLCEPMGYHNAMVPIEDGRLIVETHKGRKHYSTDPTEWDPYDPRWPEKCDHCDYQFAGLDGKGGQLFYAPVYLQPDGKEVTIHEGGLPGLPLADVGAMFYADWLGPNDRGPDGKSLALITPAGIWVVDGHADDDTRPWTRTGTPPKVTVNPTVRFTSYHGRLKNGWLEDCQL